MRRKHRGITFLLVDLRSPGVTINPLVNMAWGHEFNEEFFEDVRVPADQMVGEENRGWYVAMTLLDNERSNITGAMSVQRKIDRLLAYLGTEQGAGRSRLSRYDALRQQVAQRAVAAAVLFNLSLRIITMQRRGIVPNYEASVSKIVGYEAEQGLKHHREQGVRALRESLGPRGSDRGDGRPASRTDTWSGRPRSAAARSRSSAT